jgi:hypothetical protein
LSYSPLPNKDKYPDTIQKETPGCKPNAKSPAPVRLGEFLFTLRLLEGLKHTVQVRETPFSCSVRPVVDP